MPAPAISWEVMTSDLERVGRTMAAALARVRSPAGALAFVSGGLTHRVAELGELFGRMAPGVPLVVAGGAGVLTERREIEDQSAAVGMIWSGGRAEAHPLEGDGPEELGEALARLLGDRTSRTSPTVIAFLPQDAAGYRTLEPLREVRHTPHVFGAGTAGRPGAAAVAADGRVVPGPAAMILRGLTPAAIRTAHACRLLGPLRPITEARGAMVMAIDDEPALNVLQDLARDVAEQPLVLTVLAPEEGLDASDGERTEIAIRGVQGIDPDRRALVVSDEVRRGMRMTFAVCDASAARADLEAMARDIHRNIGGAAPRFGLYINCAGRGTRLYGAHDVDTRVITSRFGPIPLAGMQSSFEIAPLLGRPTLQHYTGVFCLFTSPS